MTPPRLVYVGRVAPDPKWQMLAHSHRHDEVIVLLRGRLQATVDATPYVARAGEILLYPAGSVHAEKSDPQDPLESLYLGLHTQEPFALPRLLPDTEGRIRQLAYWIYQDRHSAVRSVRSAAEALLAALLAELRGLAEHPVREAKLVASTRAYIWRHLTEKLPLDRLARHADLSKFHFNRLYRKLAQRTPVADVREIRISYARDLLLTSNLPLKTIAAKAGFTDEYRLSRLIRSRHNLSPGALRKKIRGQ